MEASSAPTAREGAPPASPPPPPRPDGLLSTRELRDRVTRLAELDRPPGSPGERAAAELIAGELRELGWRTRLETEVVHGTHWWPTGVPAGLGLIAGLLAAGGHAGVRRRLAAVALAAFATAAVSDDLSGGRRWFRRAFLPKRQTVNVVSELGDHDAERTVIFTAHHDSAHSGLIFHPALARAPWRRFPKLLERTNTSPPVLWGAAGGPALVGLGALAGARRLRAAASALCAGYVAALTDIALRSTVPGANDNLSAVAALLSVAHALGAQGGPPAGVRVMVVSAGSEESHQEGMRGFAARHFPALERERTHVFCLDTVGSPHLLVLEGEGMLRMYDYPPQVRELVQRCADELGIYLFPKLRLRNATDGLVALRAGYRCAAICSVDEFKAPTNYHWPTDTPDRVDYETVDEAARLCLGLTERLAPRPAGGA
jgi:hypothetical protein